MPHATTTTTVATPRTPSADTRVTARHERTTIMTKPNHRLLAPVLLALTIALLTSTGTARTFTLAPGFWPDPYRTSYVSGGSVNAFQLRDAYRESCAGWIAHAPDHVMTLTRPFHYLRITAESRGDITLILFNPRTGERFCDDGSWQIGRPEIVMDYITADEWWIYVGSFFRDEWHSYDLTVSEFTRNGWR